MRRIRAIVVAASGMFAGAAGAEVRPAGLFTDHAVLQRGIPVPVWGTAEPGEKVSVSMDGKSAAATADARGRWTAAIGPFEATLDPVELTIEGKSGKVVLRDIHVGDVWIASGQSNMEWPLRLALNPETELPAANDPKLRFFPVPNVFAERPVEDVSGAAWRACAPDSAGDFSAVAYFFGRNLRQVLNVPIGLIQSDWGGTPAEAWTSAEALKALPDFRPWIETVESPEAMGKLKAEHAAALAAREETIRDRDAGHPGRPGGWSDPATDVSGWTETPVPGHWEKNGLPGFDGVVWFRKDVEVPAAWAGKDLDLSLGPIDDDDVTWVNGTEVGRTSMYLAPRRYRVPGASAKAGRMTVVVRVHDPQGDGGFWGKPEDMNLRPADDAAAAPVPLAGPWRRQVGLAQKDVPPAPPAPGVSSAFVPTGLYNGMIAPLIPYAIRGAIWYQGESNADRAAQYRALFPAMIRDWRARWGRGDFPFLFVQLANFDMDRLRAAFGQAPLNPPAGESTWAELREAQAMTLSLPATGMATAVDIGEAMDIHPKNKQEVGRRLALAARTVAYGEKLVSSGPVYREMSAEGAAIRIRFDLGGSSGLTMRGGGGLVRFLIAGEDRKFVPADARLEGNEVVVSSPSVPKPAAVRYAWADNPEGVNFFNREGLPVLPFRTDGWPGITERK